jgi:asparagine synthase (glutamine-hydrolysing)
MCGICGIVRVSHGLDRKSASSRVQMMVHALAHRGPDQTAEAAGTNGVLGATRLAIRGPEDGWQPMQKPDGDLIVVCNGEIDNHMALRAWLETRGRRVEQATDVAVIPELYLELGDGFAERLVGAFAVAIWDGQKRRLTLARDRAGERPLFFTQHNGEISFATEISALFAACDGRLTVVPEHLREYLHTGIFVAPQTPFSEIQKVAPGEVVTFEAGGIRRRRYWRWNIRQASKRAPSVDAFDAIFREAVRRQSEVDVPFGVFLSGGVDSSLISAVVKSLRPDQPLKSYSLRFSEDSYDEGKFAAVVARQLGLEPVEVWVKPEDFPREIATLVGLVGEPLADPAWIPTALLARRAAKDVRVALVGEGGDELFGGYPTYSGAQLAGRFSKLPGPVRGGIRRLVEALPVSDKKMTVSFLLKRFVQAAGVGGMARHRTWTSVVTPALFERLGKPTTASSAEEPLPGALLDAVQLHDLETTLAEGLLTKADRASMQSALELRAPFLDLAVMEFAATLPERERVRGLQTKVFLKRYAERYLPRSIVHRRKRGLSVPLSGWLRGPLADWAEARLTDGNLEAAGVRGAAAREMLAEHKRHQADHARPLWALIVLVEWLAWTKAVGEAQS